jgi:hypothetical protein
MKTKYSDNAKYNYKYKGLRPFAHSRKGWKEGGVLFDEKLLVLEGNELPELFVIWKIEFMNRIYNHPSLTWDSKIKILTRIYLVVKKCAIKKNKKNKNLYGINGR